MDSEWGCGVRQIHVVTSCTDRKHIAVPEASRLGEIGESRLELRLEKWIQRLASIRREPTPTRELYGGEHWVEFLKLLATSFTPGFTVRGWVISAGYGLVPVDARVHPYGATFTRGNRDSVRPPLAEWPESDWWSGMAHWEGPSPEEPRTLAGLGAAVPGEPILVGASATYLRAIEADLVNLMDSRQAGEVVVFGSTLPASIKIRTDSAITYDSRLLTAVGGSRIGLNVRTMSYALREAGTVSHQALAEIVQGLMAELPEMKQPIRAISSDQDVRAFIRGILRDNQEARPSPLLREWRSMDRACEQGRFRDLFWEVHREERLAQLSERRLELESS